MADYLLSLKLLVKRLHLNHEPTEMDSWTRKDSSGSQSSVFKSRDSRASIEDTNATSDVVYRRHKVAGNDVANVTHSESTTSNAVGVFRYPSVSLRECHHCKTIIRTNSKERDGSSHICFDCLHAHRGSQTDAKFAKSPTQPNRPLLSVTDDTGTDQPPDISSSTTCTMVSNHSSDNDETICKVVSPHWATGRVSYNALETSLSQGRHSSSFMESYSPSRVSPLGSTLNADRRKSSVSTGKQRLSFSKSLPLSPQVVTKETRERQLCGMQLKLDMLKAELLAMRRTDQDLAHQLLQIHSEIQVQKVKRSCMKHSELLDDAIYEAEIADAFPEMCDLPLKSLSRLLTSNGVTNFNISCRRFSCS
ncbi:hypothetical protein ACF0H5_023023 [Mactra antiquata]